MKHLILSLIILAFVINSFSQQSNSRRELTQKDYLKKSKNQKTAAWILAGAGVGLITTGILIGNKDEVSFDDATGAATFIVIGAIPVISSIPLFIASGKNKKRAMQATAYLKTENTYAVRSFCKTSTYFPALTIKLSL